MREVYDAMPEDVFQSTPLIRGATRHVQAGRGQRGISIHAPHTRGDSSMRTSPWARTISIHAPHTRGDLKYLDRAGLKDDISIHAPHTRGDR